MQELLSDTSPAREKWSVSQLELWPYRSRKTGTQPQMRAQSRPPNAYAPDRVPSSKRAGQLKRTRWYQLRLGLFEPHHCLYAQRANRRRREKADNQAGGSARGHMEALLRGKRRAVRARFAPFAHRSYHRREYHWEGIVRPRSGKRRPPATAAHKQPGSSAGSTLILTHGRASAVAFRSSLPQPTLGPRTAMATDLIMT